MRLACVFAVCVQLLATPPLLARDVFVNNATGDDQANGLAESHGPFGGPMRTIRCGLAALGPGDRLVLVDTGVAYHESICLSGPNHHGFEGRPLIIDGGGSVIDGTVTAEPGAWHHDRNDIFTMRPRRLAYQQLFHAGKPLKHVQVASWSPDVPQLEPLEWTLTGGRIYFRPEEGRLPADYALRHAGLTTGVSLYNTRHVVVQNLVVQGFHTDGVHASDAVHHCRLENVECRANGRSGIAVSGASRVAIADSHLYDNGRVQLLVEGFARVRVRNTDLDNEAKLAPPHDVRGGRLEIDGEVYTP